MNGREQVKNELNVIMNKRNRKWPNKIFIKYGKVFKRHNRKYNDAENKLLKSLERKNTKVMGMRIFLDYEQ